MPPKKAKLRTARDVISRLRWQSSEDGSEEDQQDATLIGYMDRIEGPMEKSVKDYVSADSGGDIPEHRILYFRHRNTTDCSDDQKRRRSAREILWDRAGRVDKIFGSGNGPDAPIASETLEAVEQAIQNMLRIEHEKEERRREKAKQRARRAAYRTKSAPLRKNLTPSNQTATSAAPRFQWGETPWFVYCPDEENWTPGSCLDERRRIKLNPNKGERELVVVTWNVLFDIFDDGLEAELAQQQPVQVNDDGSCECLSMPRWKLLCSQLDLTGADLIALQEVTPSFLRLLCTSAWVREKYACSSSPADAQCVDPSGVLLLWRRTTLVPMAEACTFRCLDFGRTRSVLASLYSPQGKSTYLFAAVHLPANKSKQLDRSGSNKQGETMDLRKMARKRELCSILGGMERLSNQIASRSSSTYHIEPIIAGDFNSQNDELLNGLFATKTSEPNSCRSYRDAWESLGLGPGFTFDPEKNARAARSHSLVAGAEDGGCKRIDRVFIGPVQCSSGNSLKVTQLVPVTAGLLGCDCGSAVPPSDHFGLRVALRQSLVRHAQTNLSWSPRSLWAANSPASPHYMLAVMLDNSALEQVKSKLDPHSSLPGLHLTLLHGFIEADHGCIDLAKSTIEHSLSVAAQTVAPPTHLCFSEKGALDLFEHRSSSSIVGLPDKGSPGNQWLQSLYQVLRGHFAFCDEQEKHSSGWTPHVTLGVAGSSSNAREMIASLIRNGDWNEDRQEMAILSVDILRRGENGKFHSIASLANLPMEKLSLTANDVLKDAGASLTRQMDRQVALVMSRVRRACRHAAVGLGAEATVHVGGSMQLGAALPALSDVDAVVALLPGNGQMLFSTREHPCPVRFLEDIFVNLKEELPSACARFRPASGKTIMTIRTPGFPSVDLSLCLLDQDGNPVDSASADGLNAIRDGEEILAELAQLGGSTLVDAFQGALRIVKLWAHCRDVYGTAAGFVGGGGWALWLARCAIQAMETGDVMLNKTDCVETSKQLARYFFQNANRMAQNGPIALRPTDESDGERTTLRPHRVGNLSIIAPCSHGDLCRTVTNSSTLVIQREIQIASENLGRPDNLNLACLLNARSLADFVEEFKIVATMEIRCKPGVALPGELKAWGNRQFLNTVVALERQIGDRVRLRPKPQPVRMGKEWKSGDRTIGFVWLIGCELIDEATLLSLRCLESRELQLRAESEIAFGRTTQADSSTPVDCNMRLLKSVEAKAQVM